jgi:cytidine deaminase
MENKIINEEIKSLYFKAESALKYSYSPYSRFKVAAVLLLKNNLSFQGVNIENIAYGSTICAEKSALSQVYSNGYQKKDIKLMLILSDSNNICFPCGNCRQIMSELIPIDCKIICSNRKNEEKILTLDELLPYSFNF